MTARPASLTLDDDRTIHIVEEIRRTAASGLRFRDGLTGRTIRDGLVVSAQRMDGRPVGPAHRSSNAIHWFHASEPPGDVNYYVSVRDIRGKHLSTTLLIELPPSTSETVVSDHYLFPTIARALPPGFFSVRADLADVDATRREAPDHRGPAKFAQMEVSLADGSSWFGMSDRNGRVVVAVPALDPTRGGVEIAITVNYEDLAPPMRLTGIPTFDNICAQRRATLPPDLAPPSAGERTTITETLTPDKSLVLRTGNRSDLLVRKPTQT